jgi:predicted kinase
MKTLFLLRGVPGSGKSTLAQYLNADVHLEADQYFVVDGEYKFEPSKLRLAHQWCQDQAETAMLLNHTAGLNNIIVVSNTFTMEWEMDVYYDMAKTYGYRVMSLIVENRHGGVNTHGCPEDKVQAMRDRFEIKL